MRRVTVDLDDDPMGEIDRFMGDLGHSNRSEALRDLARRLVEIQQGRRDLGRGVSATPLGEGAASIDDGLAYAAGDRDGASVPEPSAVAVAVAAVDVIAVIVIMGLAGALVRVGVIMGALVQVLMSMGMLVDVGMGVRVVVDEVAVAVLVGVHMGVGMGVAMLVRVLVRLGMGMAVGRGLVVHRVLPVVSGGCAQRSSVFGPNTLRITASPASTVILT